MEVPQTPVLQFPTAHDVPVTFRLSQPLHQDVYLVNGELRVWDGPRQEVVSPVWTRTNAQLTLTVLGSYPLLTSQEALSALHAAVTAYDQGRGQWPLLSVAQRISHLQDFAARMRTLKREMVTLLMWEIGKTHQDAEKEFDRTLDYMNDTIDAVKDLHRVSSRFQITDGIFGQIRRAPLGGGVVHGAVQLPAQ